mgnify:CR=1 FL=1
MMADTATAKAPQVTELANHCLSGRKLMPPTLPPRFARHLSSAQCNRCCALTPHAAKAAHRCMTSGLGPFFFVALAVNRLL